MASHLRALTKAGCSLRRSLIYRRSWRTLRLGLKLALLPLRRGRHAPRREAFDLEFGVATGAEDAPVGERKAVEGGVYGPVDTAKFTLLLRHGGSGHAASIEAALRRRPYDFYDFGCGRGRALMLASEYPFGRIRGVEYDRALLESARSNLALWLAPGSPAAKHIRCRDIAVEWEDAAAWAFPQQAPAVFFINEPVGEPALGRIAARIRASLAAAPRPAFVVYLGGRYRHLWESEGDFDVIYTRGDDRVYRYGGGVEEP